MQLRGGSLNKPGVKLTCMKCGGQFATVGELADHLQGHR